MIIFYSKDIHIHIASPVGQSSLCGYSTKNWANWTTMQLTKFVDCPNCCQIVKRAKWSWVLEELQKEKIELRPREFSKQYIVPVTRPLLPAPQSDVWPEVKKPNGMDAQPQDGVDRQ